jgi:phenylpropionate dioxygenase-like ring-hydroxylating dioxygenase large terminal subunit
MTLLRNCWYAALWLADLADGKPFARTVAGERIVFWRQEDGEVAALADLCPHRMAPLSLGAIKPGQLMCRYHGLGFDARGRCVANPYGPLLASLAVRSFPVELRDGMIWVWTGTPEHADPALIPDILAFMRGLPETALVVGTIHAKASHKLFEDNILDPGHGEFLHPMLGSSGMAAMQRIVTKTETGLQLTILQPGTDIPEYFRAGMPDLDGPADGWIESVWHPSGAMLITVGATPAGRPRAEGVDTWTAHIFTPETETSTHYLYASGRSFLPDDKAFNDQAAVILRAAFTQEDLPMIEGQQILLGERDLMAAAPQLFSVDAASVQARRLYDAMVAAEQALAQAVPA